MVLRLEYLGGNVARNLDHTSLADALDALTSRETRPSRALGRSPQMVHLTVAYCCDIFIFSLKVLNPALIRDPLALTGI